MPFPINSAPPLKQGEIPHVNQHRRFHFPVSMGSSGNGKRLLLARQTVGELT
jgi:hypothetical protein